MRQCSFGSTIQLGCEIHFLEISRTGNSLCGKSTLNPDDGHPGISGGAVSDKITEIVYITNIQYLEMKRGRLVGFSGICGHLMVKYAGRVFRPMPGKTEKAFQEHS
jgi:hypothetical protein